MFEKFEHFWLLLRFFSFSWKIQVNWRDSRKGNSQKCKIYQNTSRELDKLHIFKSYFKKILVTESNLLLFAYFSVVSLFLFSNFSLYIHSLSSIVNLKQEKQRIRKGKKNCKVQQSEAHTQKQFYVWKIEWYAYFDVGNGSQFCLGRKISSSTQKVIYHFS